MKIKNQYEQDGYIIKEYDNNTIIKELIPDFLENDLPKEYNKQEIANAQILTQLEYLICLQEINSIKGGNL